MREKPYTCRAAGCDNARNGEVAYCLVHEEMKDSVLDGYLTSTVVLPVEAQARKDVPICRGVLDYFPNALAAVAALSKKGNDQHNPGQEMHWARNKSTDHADCIVRHLVDRGAVDADGVAHSAKVAWRALALLESELIAAGAKSGRNAR